MSRRDTRISRRDLGRVHQTRRARRGGRTGLALLAAVLLLGSLAAIVTAIRLHHAESGQLATTASPASNAVIFVLDGATADEVRGAAMPNLATLQRLGTTYTDAWIGQLESWEPASAATFGTGLFPRNHGIVGRVWTNTQTGTGTTTAVDLTGGPGAAERVLRSEAASPLVSALKGHDRRDTVLAVGGSRCSSAAAAAGPGADYILCATQDGRRWVPGAIAGHGLPSGSVDPQTLSVPVALGSQLGPTVEGWQAGQEDDWITRYALAAMRTVNPSLTIIVFPEIRELVPYVSPDGRDALVAQLLRGIDADIGRIEAMLHRSRRWSGTTFAVTSGEATAPFVDSVPMASLDEALIAAGAQKGYISAGGSAQIGLVVPQQSQPVAQALQAEKLTGIDAIYYKMQRQGGYEYDPQYLDPLLPAHFADVAGYLLSTVASASSPDVIAAYAPNTATPAPPLGSYTSAASSGGWAWDTQHIPLVLSGRGITPNATSTYPAMLVDIAPTIAAAMGLSEDDADGTVLADGLLNPPDGATDAQTKERGILGPLVAALQNVSGSAGS